MSYTRTTRSAAKGSSPRQHEDTASAAQSVPPFLPKTYDMVSDPQTDDIISWSPDGRSFTVWNQSECAKELLPQYFKHNNFSSFVRQLNTYGFRKSDPDLWQFANDHFIRGRKDLLTEIQRKKATAAGKEAGAPGAAAIEVGSFGGIADEVQALKRDKNVLMLELVRLRQQQQAHDEEMRRMAGRMESTEMRQQQMMAFLARAVNNPAFLQQLLSARQTQRSLDNRGRKKRRAARQSTDLGPLPSAAENPMAIMSYQPLDEQLSTQFLNLLGDGSLDPLRPAEGPGLAGEDATPSEHSQSPPHPDDWPSDLHDFGSAFDSLNLSTVPSNVRIEHVGHSGQDSGQQINEMLRHAAQENGFADIPASLAGSTGQGFSGYPGLDAAGTAAMGGFTPAGNFASEFGMPEIGPSSAPPLHSVPLQNGPVLPGPSPQHGPQTGPPSASPFSGSAVQGSQSTPHGLAGPANMLPLTPPGSDLLMPDLPENSQDAFWQQLLSTPSLNGELNWQPPTSSAVPPAATAPAQQDTFLPK